MLLRMLPVFTAVLLAGAVAGAQNNPTIENRNNQEWKVSYEPGESWPNLHFSARKWAAVRLKIMKDRNNNYWGTLWLFGFDANNHHVLLGKSQGFPLTIEGADNVHRKRIGFKSADLQTAGGTTNPLVRLSGIWQRGRAVGNRDSQRMQIKVHDLTRIGKSPAQAPDRSRDCEDDPDTDVLEEGGEASGDDPPTEP
jgi:hypothetical protein